MMMQQHVSTAEMHLMLFDDGRRSLLDTEKLILYTGHNILVSTILLVAAQAKLGCLDFVPAIHIG